MTSPGRGMGPPPPGGTGPAAAAQALWRRAASGLLTHAVANVMSIGVFTGPSPLELSPPAGVPNPVLTPASVTDAVASLVADPFMLLVDGAWYMFFEVMAWRGRARKGEIGLATSRDGLRWEYQRIVLAEPFHLSYPYVLADGSDVYMIPESHRGGSVRLYRADPFPHRWVLAGTLLSGPVFLDSSVFRHEGRWWMLTTTSRRHDDLRLFHAPALAGPWREHPRSPLLEGDPAAARPAGRVIDARGALLRFAQDCGPAYGHAVRAFEITRLDAREYAERPAGDGPVLAGSGRGWNRCGMHTLDAHPWGDGWIAAVDGWYDVRGPLRALRRARGLLRRPPHTAGGTRTPS